MRITSSIVRLEGGELLRAHSQNDCAGPPCPIHSPTDHHMRSWPQHYRHDRAMMERVCAHGVGHPDPDCFNKAALLHGCDGCCQDTSSIRPRISLGETRKEAGIAIVSMNNKTFLAQMRDHARVVTKEKGQVSCDDLRVFALEYRIEPKSPNAWGAVFSGREWIPVGYKKSCFSTNNARRITVWRLRSQQPPPPY